MSELQPDLVASLSSWETLDRLLDGAWNPYFSPESDERILGLFARMVDRLTTSGARVVLVTLPDHIDSALQPAQPDRTNRTRHLNALLAEVVRRDPARVSLVHMDDIVCPSIPCPPTVDGIGLRTIDGIHFDGPEAATFVASRLADRLLAVPCGNGRTPG